METGHTRKLRGRANMSKAMAFSLISTFLSRAKNMVLCMIGKGLLGMLMTKRNCDYQGTFYVLYFGILGNLVIKA